MVPLLYPAPSFSQIQNNGNGDIAVLAPPYPFATQSKGLSPVVVGERIKREEGSSTCTTFVSFVLINCVNNRHAGAPSPRPWRRRKGFAAAALIAIQHNESRSAINDEKIGEAGAGLVSQHNNRPMEATQTIYCLGWRVGKEKEEEGEGEVGIILFLLWRCNYDVWFDSNATIYSSGRSNKNNPPVWVNVWKRRRRRRKNQPSSPHPSQRTETAPPGTIQN